MRWIFAALVLVTLSACSTTPTPMGAARPAPADRVLRLALPTSPTPARAVFVRDQGAAGALVQFHVHIDGQRAASLEAGEMVEFVLEPGRHRFGAIQTELFVKAPLPENEIEEVLAPGAVYRYRVTSTYWTAAVRVQRADAPAQ